MRVLGETSDRVVINRLEAGFDLANKQFPVDKLWLKTSITIMSKVTIGWI